MKFDVVAAGTELHWKVQAAPELVFTRTLRVNIPCRWTLGRA
jgi:hypothetical protein